MLFLAGSYDASLEALERTLELEPMHYAALAGKGIILIQQGKEAEAQAPLKRALAINPWLKEPTYRRVLNPNPLNFPFQLDAGMRLDALAHGFAQRFDIGGAGAVEIDQEIAVQLGDLRLADFQPAAAGLVHQFPGADAGRVLEGGAAGAIARLARLALALDLGHLGGDRVRIAGAALEHARW